MSGGTPPSSDNAPSNSDESANAETFTAEPRSQEKIAQINLFAVKYDIQLDPIDVTADTLNLDDAKLDEIEVNVPMPQLLCIDANGNQVSKDIARRTQALEFDTRVREARERVVRMELKNILLSPDFNFINSDPSNLVGNDAARSSNDDAIAAPAPVVPTPAEQQQGSFNHARFPDKVPTGFDHNFIQAVFDDLKLPSDATDKEYARILDARINQFRKLLQQMHAARDEYNSLLKQKDTDPAVLLDMKSSARVIHAYITSIQTNLEYLRTLRRSRAPKSTKPNAKSKNSNNNNNNNNSSTRPSASARRRRRNAKNKADIAEHFNYSYTQPATVNQNNNNNNNSDTVMASASNSSKSQTSPPDQSFSFGPDQPDVIRRAQQWQLVNNSAEYDCPTGEAAASHTAVLFAKADQLRAKQKKVCVLCCPLFSGSFFCRFFKH